MFPFLDRAIARMVKAVEADDREMKAISRILL